MVALVDRREEFGAFREWDFTPCPDLSGSISSIGPLFRVGSFTPTPTVILNSDMIKRPQTSVFIAISLDGFIARSNGGLDWLERANSLIPTGEDCGYAAFLASIDTIILGARTFETVQGFESWPYAGKRVIVLTARPTALPETIPAEITDTPPAELLSRLYDEGARHVYIDGGITVQGFLRAGLIDRLTVTVIPILLGEGRPLFGALAADIDLALEDYRAYDFGFTQTTYRVCSAAS